MAISFRFPRSYIENQTLYTKLFTHTSQLNHPFSQHRTADKMSKNVSCCESELTVLNTRKEDGKSKAVEIKLVPPSTWCPKYLNYSSKIETKNLKNHLYGHKSCPGVWIVFKRKNNASTKLVNQVCVRNYGTAFLEIRYASAQQAQSWVNDGNDGNSKTSGVYFDGTKEATTLCSWSCLVPKKMLLTPSAWISRQKGQYDREFTFQIQRQSSGNLLSEKRESMFYALHCTLFTDAPFSAGLVARDMTIGLSHCLFLE